MAAEDFTRIEVHGARELAAAMRAAGVALSDLNEANQAAGSVVLSAANPPRRSGKLAASGRVGRARSRARVTYSKVYAPPVHWGWPRRHIDPNPWLSIAAKVTEPAWQAIYLGALQDVADKVGAST